MHLDPIFCILITATLVPFSTVSYARLIKLMQDLDLDSIAAKLLHAKKLKNLYNLNISLCNKAYAVT